MKKLLTVIIVFVLFIVTSLTVDILRQQFYPYEYQDVMESFFGKYHIKNVSIRSSSAYGNILYFLRMRHTIPFL